MRFNEYLNNMSWVAITVIVAVFAVVIGIVSYMAYNAFNEPYIPQEYQPISLPAQPFQEDTQNSRVSEYASQRTLNRRQLELPAKIVTESASTQATADVEAVWQLPDDVDDSPAHQSRWNRNSTENLDGSMQTDFFQALNDRLQSTQ